VHILIYKTKFIIYITTHLNEFIILTYYNTKNELKRDTHSLIAEISLTNN
jgi:hypothetical protein